MGVRSVPIAMAALALMAGLAAPGLASANAPAVSAAPRAACPTDPLAPAVTPVVQVSARPGPAGAAAYGGMQYRRAPGVGPGQVALTFDDGPDPLVTPQVLAILDRHCIKAAFFMVGYYARAHPELVREVAARGHTIGTHTWLHPDNLRLESEAAAKRQIIDGFAAVEEALATAPPASQARLSPFFRFPGLNDTPALISWLGNRQVAVFSADDGADDWKKFISPVQIEARGLRSIVDTNGGVIILHDTHEHTALALDSLIVQLEQKGYRFVQIAPEPGAHDRAAAMSEPLLHRLPQGAEAGPVALARADHRFGTLPSLDDIWSAFMDMAHGLIAAIGL